MDQVSRDSYALRAYKNALKSIAEPAEIGRLQSEIEQLEVRLQANFDNYVEIIKTAATSIHNIDVTKEIKQEYIYRVYQLIETVFGEVSSLSYEQIIDTVLESISLPFPSLQEILFSGLPASVDRSNPRDALSYLLENRNTVERRSQFNRIHI